MGIYLKDTIEGTCRKAINDERGNNILETYQKKLGIGEFIGNIDLISKNSVCLCWSIKCEGTFPLDNMVCILKTENYEEAGDTQAFVFQTALPVDGENEGRCFIRKKDLVGDEVSASDWHEIPSDATINKFEINFDSEDDENPVAWTSMRKIVSGKIKDLFGNVSIMAKNIRWLYKMLGTTDIASIGGGTLTGAISKLNTDISKADEVKYYHAPEPPTNSIFTSFSHWVFHVTKVGRVVTITTNFAGHMKASWDNQLLLTLPAEYSPYDWYEIFPHITQGGNAILVCISHDGSVEFNSLGKEINDWLARWCITYIARE